MKKGKSESETFEEMTARIEKKKAKIDRLCRCYITRKMFSWEEISVKNFFPKDVWLDGIASYNTSNRDLAAEKILKVVAPMVEGRDLTKITKDEYYKSVYNFKGTGVTVSKLPEGYSVEYEVNDYSFDSRPISKLVVTADSIGEGYNESNFYGLATNRDELLEYFKQNKGLPKLTEKFLDKISLEDEFTAIFLREIGIGITEDFKLKPMLSVDGKHFVCNVLNREITKQIDEVAIANHILGKPLFKESSACLKGELLNPIVDGEIAEKVLKEYYAEYLKTRVEYRKKVAEAYTQWAKDQTILCLYHVLKQEGKVFDLKNLDDGLVYAEGNQKQTQVTKLVEGEETQNNSYIYPELALVNTPLVTVVEKLSNHIERVEMISENPIHIEAKNLKYCDKYGSLMFTDCAYNINDPFGSFNIFPEDDAFGDSWGDILGDWF